jgi:hypothetical protein
VLNPVVSERSRRSVAALDRHVLGRPPSIGGRLERRVGSNLLEVLHTTSNAGVESFLIDTATTPGKRKQGTSPTHEALGKNDELTKWRCLNETKVRGAWPTRKILKDRFGALEAVANSSIKLARYATEDELAMDLLVAESVLEFGSSLREARDGPMVWARAQGVVPLA